MVDKPPKQGAEIIDLFSRRKVPPPPKRLGAEVVNLSDVRRYRNDETLDISPDAQDAQIIEFATPSEIRQEVSELIGGFSAKEDDSEESNPQNYKEIAEGIAKLLDRAYERPDDKPGDNCTKKLGECILRLTAIDPRTVKILSTPGVFAELERIISVSRHPTRFDRHTASMTEIAWQYLVTKSTEDNTNPEPPSIA